MEHQRTAVIVDPQPLWLEAVQHVLARIGVEVVAKATSPAEGLALVERTKPDILVTEVDSDAGDPTGTNYLRSAVSAGQNLRMVVLSRHTTPEYIDAALEAGAVAYVIKTAHPDDLASAIRQAFDHSIFLARSRRGPLAAPAPPVAAVTRDHGLTTREVEILRLVAEGHSNAELARLLWVTEQTIKFHLSNIYRKLHVANRTEASRWAQLNGLLGPVPVARVA
jgi:DNA-binding NarL/FixJ family response regulator